MANDATRPFANRFWGSVDPQQRAHLALVAPPEQSTPVSSGKVATFQIYDPVDSWGQPFGVSSKEVSAALLSLGDEIDTIELRINSPGGDAFEAMAIINALRNHPATVVAVVDGLAASAAADVAVSADRLIMANNSQLMIHRSWGLELGTTEDLASYAQMLANLDNAQADLMVAKAGGTRDEWLAAMTPGTWYSAEQAKDAGLADEIQPVKPASAKESQPSQRFDLSILPERDPDRSPFAPAARLQGDPHTPADMPVAPSTTPEEADTMSDTIPKAVCEALGLPDDADEATVTAAAAKLKTERDEAAAKADARPKPNLDVAAVTAALEADGKLVVSKARLDALEAQAAEGAQARAKQINDERDGLIEAAMASGKISRSPETRTVWEGEFARNYDNAKADLESLPSRFPVTAPLGHQGDDETDGAVMSDKQADALSALSGVSKEALLNG